MNRWAAFLFLWIFTASCSGDRKERGRMPLPVRTLTVQKQTFARVLEATGEVVALHTAVVSATTDGRVACCLWTEGDEVKAGQTLFQIERESSRRETDIARQAYYAAAARTADVKAGVRQEEIRRLEQEVEAARERVEFAQRDYKRLEKLLETNGISRETLEKAQVELVNARTRLEMAISQLQMARTGPTRTQVAVAEAAEREAWEKWQQAKSKYQENIVDAPFSGTITRVLARPGDTVSARAGLLEMADLGKRVVRFAIPERMALQVQAQAPVRMRFDAHPGQVFSGRVTRLFPVIDEQTRVLWAHAEPDASVRLLPGMFARVEVLLEETPEALALPESALVQTADGQTRVFVLQGQTVRSRPVKTGPSSRGLVRVLEGLAEGDVVVAENADQLRDGQTVLPAADAGGQPETEKTPPPGMMPSSRPHPRDGKR